MTDQVTSIEQSKRLIELGVPAEKASIARIFTDGDGEVLDWDCVVEQNGKFFMSKLAMHSLAIDSDSPVEVYCQLYDAKDGNYDHSYRSDCPAFTVADLLEKVLPNVIQDAHNTYELTLKAVVGGGWRFCYTPVLTPLEADNIGDEMGDNLIELLCNRIEWIVSNGYKLNI
jgi:hypothetical protein